MGDKTKEPEYKTSLVIQTVTRMMIPFLLMFGLSVMAHGHLTPGGGFQGGVIIGASFILLGLAFNKDEGRRAVPEGKIKCLASSGILVYMIVGLVGIVAGYSFLANRSINFPPVGELGGLFSGGTLMWINIGVGITVSGVAIELFYAFLEEKRDPAYYKNKKTVHEKRRWSDGGVSESSSD
ncbi:MAG: MnhB domain-containing protein [bacterium]